VLAQAPESCTKNLPAAEACRPGSFPRRVRGPPV